MKYTNHFLEKIASSAYWSGYVTAAIGAFVSFMAPIWSFVLMALVLVVLDMVTGIRAAIKRKERIKSRGLYRGIEKFALYFASIFVAEQMRLTFFPVVPITHLVAFGICITEFFSMVENVETVTGVNILRRLKKVIPGLTPEEMEDANDNDKNKQS